MSNTIVLYGGLREQYGESFRMECRDTADAFRGLACQLPGFREAVRYDEFFLVREMPNGTLALTEEMLHLGMDNCKLHFLPAIEGYASQGKKGGVKMVLGVALIGASAIFIPGSAAFAGMALQTMGIMTGAALALGGLALALSPTPKLETGKGDSTDSFLFNGSSKASGQNFAVPIGIGVFRVPHLPVATQIVTNEYSAVTPARDDYYDSVRNAGGVYYNSAYEE